MTDRHQLSDIYDHQPFPGAWKTLMLATTPRSGSHYLGHLISANKTLGSPLEYFNEQHFRTWSEYLGCQDPIKILDYIRNRRTGHLGWFSFKAHWPQYQYFHKLGLEGTEYRPEKVIWLKRKDVLAQAISWAMAKQTGKYIYFHQLHKKPRYSFRDVSVCLFDIFYYERCWENYFRENGNPEIVLFFEDIQKNPRQALEHIYLHIGFQSADLVNFHYELDSFTKKQGDCLNLRWKNLFQQDLQDRKNQAGIVTRFVRVCQRNPLLRRWVRPILQFSSR